MANGNYYVNKIFNLLQDGIDNPENLEEFKSFAYFIIESQDRDGAIAVLNKIESVFGEFSFSENTKQVLYFWFLRLKLFAFDSLPLKEQLEIFEKYVPDALEFNLDVQSAAFKFIDHFNSGPIIEQMTKNYLNSLLNSNSILGRNKPAFQKNNFVPTVKNWLKEYSYSINKRSSNEAPNSFSIIFFINNNKNTRYLSDEEIRTMNYLLELYNWLINPVVYTNEQKATNKFSNIQKFNIPVGQDLKFSPKPQLQNNLNARQGNVPPAVKPILPKFSPPQGIKTVNQPNNIMPGLSLSVDKLRESAAQKSAGEFTDIHRIKNEIEERKQIAQKEIDKKLEDLKKRQGDNNN